MDTDASPYHHKCYLFHLLLDSLSHLWHTNPNVHFYHKQLKCGLTSLQNTCPLSSCPSETKLYPKNQAVYIWLPTCVTQSLVTFLGATGCHVTTGGYMFHCCMMEKILLLTTICHKKYNIYLYNNQCQKSTLVAQRPHGKFGCWVGHSFCPAEVSHFLVRFKSWFPQDHFTKLSTSFLPIHNTCRWHDWVVKKIWAVQI